MRLYKDTTEYFSESTLSYQGRDYEELTSNEIIIIGDVFGVGEVLKKCSTSVGGHYIKDGALLGKVYREVSHNKTVVFNKITYYELAPGAIIKIGDICGKPLKKCSASLASKYGSGRGIAKGSRIYRDKNSRTVSKYMLPYANKLIGVPFASLLQVDDGTNYANGIDGDLGEAHLVISVTLLKLYDVVAELGLLFPGTHMEAEWSTGVNKSAVVTLFIDGKPEWC